MELTRAEESDGSPRVMLSTIAVVFLVMVIAVAVASLTAMTMM